MPGRPTQTIQAAPRIMPFAGGTSADAATIGRDTSAWLHRFEPGAFSEYAEFSGIDTYWSEVAEARRAGGRLGIAQAPWRRYPLDVAGLPLITDTALILVLAESRPMLHLAMLAGLTYGWLENTTLEFRGDKIVALWDQARIPKKHLLKSGSSLGVVFDFPEMKSTLQERFPQADFDITLLLPATAEAWALRFEDQSEYLDQLGRLPHFIVPVRGKMPDITR